MKNLFLLLALSTTIIFSSCEGPTGPPGPQGPPGYDSLGQVFEANITFTEGNDYFRRITFPSDIVVYESTVYPGATEEECVPVLEKTSNLKFNQDFFVGYSPERM